MDAQLELGFIAQIKAKLGQSMEWAYRTKESLSLAIMARAEAGLLLIEAKSKLPKSISWLDWLKEKFGGEPSVRTLQRVEAMGRDYLEYKKSDAAPEMAFVEWLSRMRKLPPAYQQLEMLPESARGAQVEHDHSERWILTLGKAWSEVRALEERQPVEAWSPILKITVRQKIEPLIESLSGLLAKL